MQVTLREARLVLSGVARKEPHYRVYFRPSLGAALGRTLLLPDCDALLGSTTPEPFASIQELRDSSSPPIKVFCEAVGCCVKAEDFIAGRIATDFRTQKHRLLRRLRAVPYRA